MERRERTGEFQETFNKQNSRRSGMKSTEEFKDRVQVSSLTRCLIAGLKTNSTRRESLNVAFKSVILLIKPSIFRKKKKSVDFEISLTYPKGNS